MIESFNWQRGLSNRLLLYESVAVKCSEGPIVGFVPSCKEEFPLYSEGRAILSISASRFPILPFSASQRLHICGQILLWNVLMKIHQPFSANFSLAMFLCVSP